MLEALLLSLGLAMDAIAVSVSRGLAARSGLGRGALYCALWFGGFQSGMSAIGWLLGETAAAFAKEWSPYIACALLAFVGGKMIWEGLARGDGSEGAAEGSPFAPSKLATLALATSIDALAAGVSLPLIEAPIGVSIALIGLVTALLSALGVLVGRAVGHHLDRGLDVAGGLVLVGLGIKIVIAG